MIFQNMYRFLQFLNVLCCYSCGLPCVETRLEYTITTRNALKQTKLIYFNICLALAQYKGEGKLEITGKTEETTATMDVTCDKTTYVCETNWKFKHKKCPATCTARTTINYAREDKLAIFTKYGPNQNKELNHEVLVKDQGKTLNIINTWNPVSYFLRLS